MYLCIAVHSKQISTWDKVDARFSFVDTFYCFNLHINLKQTNTSACHELYNLGFNVKTRRDRDGAKALWAKKFLPKCSQSVQSAKRFEISPSLPREQEFTAADERGKQKAQMPSKQSLHEAEEAAILHITITFVLVIFERKLQMCFFHCSEEAEKQAKFISIHLSLSFLFEISTNFKHSESTIDHFLERLRGLISPWIYSYDISSHEIIAATPERWPR